MWLPSQHIDAPVSAGSGKTKLHLKLARNLQEDGDAGEAHLQRDSNTLFSLEPQSLPNLSPKSPSPHSHPPGHSLKLKQFLWRGTGSESL